MRVGVSLRSGYPVDDPRVGARWMIERARAARDADLDSLFVGDHHVVPVPYYQNAPVLGRLLAEWGSSPAGALFLLPLWHPVIVAEQVGTLAALAEGRFILQCAVGAGAEQFAGLGVELGDRRRRFEAGLAVIRKLLAGEDIPAAEIGGGEIDGADVLDIGPARIAPVPTSPVEVWIGGHAAPAIDRAARLGDGWLAGPEAVPARAGELVRRYRERCGAHGTAPTAVAIRRDIHVGADHDDAQRVAGPVLARGYRGFDPAACVVGGPAEVAEQLAALAELGFTDVIIRHLADEQAEVLDSFARLADVRAMVASA